MWLAEWFFELKSTCINNVWYGKGYFQFSVLLLDQCPHFYILLFLFHFLCSSFSIPGNSFVSNLAPSFDTKSHKLVVVTDFGKYVCVQDVWFPLIYFWRTDDIQVKCKIKMVKRNCFLRQKTRQAVVNGNEVFAFWWPISVNAQYHELSDASSFQNKHYGLQLRHLILFFDFCSILWYFNLYCCSRWCTTFYRCCN